MKKKLLLALPGAILAALVLFFLFGTGTDAVAQLNENSLLPVPLCTPEAEALAALTESLMYVPGMGEYALDNDRICVYFSGWPDAAYEYHVTHIQLYSADYHALGIRAGDPLQAAQTSLERLGYTRLAREDAAAYGRKNVTVTLYHAGDLVTGIDLRVHTTNRRGLIF